MAKYPDELKREALNLAAKPGMTVAQVERNLGITPTAQAPGVFCWLFVLEIAEAVR